MKNHFKYLTPGDEDKSWGLYLTSIGRALTPVNYNYPATEHPNGYYFSWKNGRTLNEYQINYISKGSGVLENENGRFAVKAGSLMIIRKNEWHRYRPIKSKGWTEHYIGFDGEFAERYLQINKILQGQSVIQCGLREEFIDTYTRIFDLVQKEEPGFQHVSAGLIIQLLGYFVAWQKQRDFSGKPIEKIIQQARYHIRNNTHAEVDLEALSEEYNIGYSYFRRMFKKYTGVAPHQYHLDLKVMRAKEMILTTDKSIKEISYELGFQSVHYFSRLFKKKIGQNPTEIRNTVLEVAE